MTAHLGVQRLAGHAALYAMASVVPIVSAIALTPAVTRTLGATQYGLTATALVALQVTSLLGTFGLPAAITRHALIERSGLSGASRLVLWAAALAAVSGVIIALASTTWWPLAVGSPWRAVVPLAVAAGSLLSVVTCYQSLLRAQDRPVAFVVTTAALSLGGQAAGLAAVQIWSGTAETYLTGMAGVYAVVSSVVLIDSARSARAAERQHPTPRSAPHQTRSDLRGALRLAIPTVPHTLAILLTTGASVALATRMFDHRTAGQLQLILLLGTAPTLALNAINNLWAPAVYRTAPGERGRLVGVSLTRVVLCVGVLALCLSLGAPLALEWLAPESIINDAPTWTVGLCAAAVIPAAIYLGNVHILFAEARAAALALITPGSLVISVVVATLAARAWGPQGLVLVPVTFYLTQAVAVSTMRKHVSHEAWSGSRTALIAVAAGALICGTAWLPTSGPAVWGRAGVGVAVLGAACALAFHHRQSLLRPLS